LSWAEEMLASYRELNPQQAKWFDTIEVADEAARDELEPEMETWCYVADADGLGNSKEYVYDSNIADWVDAEIDGQSTRYGGSSGKAAQAELLARLQPDGYLHDTFGPDGQNKAACDFVYLLLGIGALTEKTMAKTGNTLRWDQDGTVTDVNNMPIYDVSTNMGIITVSSTDGFDLITNVMISSFGAEVGKFRGACPKFNFPGVNNNLSGASNKFSGQMPLFTCDAREINWSFNAFMGNMPPFNLAHTGQSTTFNVGIILNVNKFSGILPNIYTHLWSEVGRNNLSSNPNISSVDEFLQFLYENRATYANTRVGAPGVNISDLVEPSPVGVTPEADFTANGVANPKGMIWVLENKPAGYDDPDFRVWDIQHSQT
jgi:hypothetical protein